MAREFKTPITVAGDVTTSGKLKVTESGANEGGQIELAVPSSGSAISTNVTIDVYQNKLRFFEAGGSNRGYYVDITGGASSAGTSLSGGSTGAMNYAQTEGTKQSAVSSAGTTIVSVSITTNGYPVLVNVTGDVENNSAGGWVVLQLYRGATAIGNPVHAESSAASENVPYALNVIDTPAAGTYTYALKLNNSAGGTFNFGESDGPVITAVELSGPKGDTGSAGAAYTLPTATGSVLGGVKIGTNVSIDGSGVISVPRLDSVSHTFTGTTGFTTSSSQSAVTTGSSTALTTTSSFALDTGYSLLNSNTAQTIAGAKTFSTSVSTPTITAPTTTVGTTISTVTPVTPSTGYITYTTAAAHGLIAGQIVTIGNLSPSYSFTNVRIFSVPTTTTFVIASTSNIGTATSQTGSITTALLTIGNSASTIVLTNSPTATLPMFIARKTATQVLGPAANTTMNFSTNGSTVLNRGGFTMSAGVVTVPMTGYYRIRGTLYWDAAVTTGNNKVIYIYINGAVATRNNYYGGLTYDWISETCAEHTFLNAGDTVAINGYQSSPSNVNVLASGSDTNWQYGTSIFIEYKGN